MLQSVVVVVVVVAAAIVIISIIIIFLWEEHTNLVTDSMIHLPDITSKFHTVIMSVTVYLLITLIYNL
jgi:hypothetical protein